MPDRNSEVFGVDARKGDNDLVMDFSANSVLEQNLMRGHDRTTLPVGSGQVPDQWDSTAGRATRDYQAAKELGTQGRK